MYIEFIKKSFVSDFGMSIPKGAVIPTHGVDKKSIERLIRIKTVQVISKEEAMMHYSKTAMYNSFPNMFFNMKIVLKSKEEIRKYIDEVAYNRLVENTVGQYDYSPLDNRKKIADSIMESVPCKFIRKDVFGEEFENEEEVKDGEIDLTKLTKKELIVVGAEHDLVLNMVMKADEMMDKIVEACEIEDAIEKENKEKEEKEKEEKENNHGTEE